MIVSPIFSAGGTIPKKDADEGNMYMSTLRAQPEKTRDTTTTTSGNYYLL